MQRASGMISVNEGYLDPAKAKALRLAAGFRFRVAAAKAIPVNLKTLQLWEDPETPVRPYLDTLQAFARAYGCEVADFLTIPDWVAQDATPLPASAGAVAMPQEATR